MDDQENKVLETIIITPKQNCKLCWERGWYNYWAPGRETVTRHYSKNGQTQTNDYQPERRPCDCLSKQYLKLNLQIKPKFEEKDGKVFIKLENFSEKTS